MKNNIFVLLILSFFLSCRPSNKELIENSADNLQKARDKGEKSLVMQVRRLQKENKFDSAQGICIFFRQQFPNSKFISEIDKLYSDINQQEKEFKDSLKK